jgi:hypothetical protein
MAHLDALNEVHHRMGIEPCETWAQYEREGRVRHPIPREIPMTEKLKATHTQPGGFVEEDESASDGVENDSLGTIDIADSTGTDEKKETGDAKDQNKPTRED